MDGLAFPPFSRRRLSGRLSPSFPVVAGRSNSFLETIFWFSAIALPTVPVVAVGRQTYKGFSAEAWNNLLDLADYPKSAGFGAKPSGGLTQ